MLRWGGVIYLVAFALTSFRSALRPGALEQSAARPAASVAATTLALTWLNPHVYLDTVLMLGTVTNNFGSARWWAAAGAGAASVLWFAGLGSALTVLEEAHRQGSWRALPDEDLAGRGAALSITVEAMVRTSPLAPERGETRRVVAVLRRMPKRTVTRFTRVWNPLLLRTMLSFGLRTLRKEAAEDAAHASGA